MKLYEEPMMRCGPLGGAQEFEWWKTQDRRLAAGTNVSVRLTPGRPLGPARVEEALAALRLRHEALRTRIVPGADGRPEQRTDAPPPAPLVLLADPAPADLEQWERGLWEPEFDLTRDAPFRAGAVLRDGRVTDVLMVVSHCVFDGHSIPLLHAAFAEETAEETAEGTAAEGRAEAAPGRPLLDSALAERDGDLARLRAASTAHWAKEVRDLPNRMFRPARDGEITHYSARCTTDRLAILLALVARRHRTSPAAVYTAAVLAVLAALSQGPRSVVRTHFAGRTRAESGTIGCFHTLLPVAVDVSDRPGLGTLIDRTSVGSLRAQSRYRIPHLTWREILTAEERRRGVSFAEGTTVNFAFDEAYAGVLRRGPDELGAALAGTVGESDVFLGRNDTGPDDRGIDSYLMTRVRGTVTEIVASFNGNVLAPPQMRAVLTGPERLLAAHLREDVTWEGIRDVARSGGAAPPDSAPPVFAGVDLVRPDRVDEALLCHPAVRRSRTSLVRLPGGGTELVAHVVCTGPPGAAVAAAGLREHLLRRTRPGASVTVPHRIHVEYDPEGEVPGEVPGEERPAERPGDAGVGPDRAAESLRLLADTAAEVNGGTPFDPDRGYTESGGALAVVPAVVARLAEHGRTGLGPHDFTLPVSLRSLALELRAT